MRVIDIIAGTTVDGPGFRTAIYFSGCEHACPGCHNPSTWSHDAGHTMTIDTIMSVIEDNDFDVTFTGGDPLYQAAELMPLISRIKETGKTIWLYTGFSFEEAMANPVQAEIIKAVDVVVDGPFIISLRDENLVFRGSSNQRVIDIKATLDCSRIVTIDVDDTGL